MSKQFTRLSLQGFLIFSLFLFSSNWSFAQNTCKDGGPEDVTLNGVGPIIIIGTTQRATAKKAYKKELAKAAQNAGSCPGSCTVATCTAFFDG